MERRSIQLVNDFDQAYLKSLSHQGSNDDREDAAVLARVSPLQALVIRVLDQQGIARIGGIGYIPFPAFFRRSDLSCGIFSSPIDQQQFMLILHQPKINRLSFEDFFYLGGDNGVQFVHFQGRVEYFFDVIELGQAQDRLEVRIALRLVVSCARKGGSGRALCRL